MEEKEGYIYFVFNKEYPYVKMGRTGDCESLEPRYKTCYANPEIEYFEVSDQYNAEKELHKSAVKHHICRELFQNLTKEEAREYCKRIQQKYKRKKETQEEILNEKDKVKKFVREVVKRSKDSNWKNCCQEWIYEGRKIRPERCICGQPIIYSHYLTNRLTNQEIIVGTNCLEYIMKGQPTLRKDLEILTEKTQNLERLKTAVRKLGSSGQLSLKLSSFPTSQDPFTIKLPFHPILFWLSYHFPIPVFSHPRDSSVLLLKSFHSRPLSPLSFSLMTPTLILQYYSSNSHLSPSESQHNHNDHQDNNQDNNQEISCEDYCYQLAEKLNKQTENITKQSTLSEILVPIQDQKRIKITCGDIILFDGDYQIIHEYLQMEDYWLKFLQKGQKTHDLFWKSLDHFESLKSWLLRHSSISPSPCLREQFIKELQEKNTNPDSPKSNSKTNSKNSKTKGKNSKGEDGNEKIEEEKEGNNEEIHLTADCQKIADPDIIKQKLYSKDGFTLIGYYVKSAYDKGYFRLLPDTRLFQFLKEKKILGSDGLLPIKFKRSLDAPASVKQWLLLTVNCRDWNWSAKNLQGTSFYYLSHQILNFTSP